MNYIDELFLLLPDPILQTLISEFAGVRTNIRHVLSQLRQGKEIDGVKIEWLRTNLTPHNFAIVVAGLYPLIRHCTALKPTIVHREFKDGAQHHCVIALAIIEPEASQINMQSPDLVPDFTLAQTKFCTTSSRDLRNCRQELFAQMVERNVRFSSRHILDHHPNTSFVIDNL